ncbi:MAG: hypothetical protein ACRDLQ_04635 [Solirubrobacterales bacterium]
MTCSSLGTAALRLAGVVLVGCALAAPAAQAAFPGGNGKITFSSDRERPFQSFFSREIFSMRPDGTGLVRLTDNTGTSWNDFDPSWSADGRKIAFVRADSSGEGSGIFIHVMNADGSGITKVPNTGFNAGDPAWSPDGERIVFSNVPGPQCGYTGDECRANQGGYDIYTIRPDGSGLTRLTTAARNDIDPAWSPDGSQIAFVSNRLSDDALSGHHLLHRMNPDGSGQTRMAPFSTDDGHPNWSPDGRRIVFHSGRPPHDGGRKIWVMNADGTDPVRVSHGGGVVDRVPSWSPDGHKIAFTSSLGGWRIYSIDDDGTNRALLTDSRGSFDFDPDWQPVPPGNRPPSCSGVTASTAELSPADRSLQLVALAGAGDPDGDIVTLSVTGVTQDEPLTGGDDKTTPDAFSKQLTREPSVAALLENDPNEVYLRAEARNGRDGRVYRVAFTAEDIYGATCSGTVSVSVPRKAGRPAVDSAPPSHDSFG